ncbi:MAG: 30S ribosome-binding factor RbfA [Acidobacteriota bacterium]|nr:30S ribosome-binding factor RbfA [Acidobacteriota bacterium]
MDKRRTARVGQAIREELSQIISFEMNDPRLRGITVADVTVTPDGRQATVHVGVYGSPEEQKEAMGALIHSAGFLRHQVAVRMELRHAPELLFLADSGTAAASRVEVLLDRVRKKGFGPENGSGS